MGKKICCVHPTIADIFQEEPLKWGLRGDPILWAKLKGLSEFLRLPETRSDLELKLGDMFKLVTNHDLGLCDEFHLFDCGSSGMSSGFIDGKTWRQEIFPSILDYYDQNKNKLFDR